MRVLLTTQPGHGHFDPMVPYAAAFRAAGHDVRVASSAAFARTVEAAGFGFVPVGESFSWDDVEKTFPEFVAGQVAGIPVVCASWSALPTDARRWGSVLDWPSVLDHYETVAKTFGVDVEPVWDRQLTLTGLPPSWFTEVGADLTVRHFRLPLAEAPDRPGPDWLDALGRDRPLVYATLGTVFNRMRKPREALLAGLDADVLLTVGRNVDPDTLGPTPPTMRVERFVPQSYALARASLLVSHAGLGTMLGAIYHGVPMVPLVLGAEHPLNAASAKEAGLAFPLTLTEADAVRKECDGLEPVNHVVSLTETYVKDRSHR